MAPHHHLRAAFVANPALFSFPAPSCTSPLVHPVGTHAQGTLLEKPSPRTRRTRMSTMSVVGTDSGTMAGRQPPPVEFKHGETTRAEEGVMTEPFWKGFMTGRISSRARERGGVLVPSSSLTASHVEEREGKQIAREMGTERKRALIFAGLGSYPHQPSSPTAASLRLWERASEALVTPCPEIGYIPRAIEQEKSAMSGSLGDGMDPALWRRWNKGWLRGWVGNRSINELMLRPDIKAAYVLTSNLAILASAQQHAPEPTSFLPQDVTHLLGYGFIGTLTALVATDKVKLEDAIRLACIYASLPAGGVQEAHMAGTLTGARAGTMRDHFMTTLLTLSHDTSLTRKYSLSEAVPATHYQHLRPTSSSSSSPLAHVLDVIRDLQEHEGWNESLLPSCAQAEDEGYGVHGDAGDFWTAREWAGEAMINSPRTLVVSGTKGAVIKIIDRLRGGGLATPVMDLHMPQALKGCPFYPAGGANGLTGKCEPNVVILDGMTAKPLPMDDIPSALTAYLTRPLQWAETTRSLWAGETTTTMPVASSGEGNTSTTAGQPTTHAKALVDEIAIVGRGARGLGIAIDREIGETRLQRQRENKDVRDGVSSSTSTTTNGSKTLAGRNAGRSAAFRRRLGSSVFPMTANVEAGEKDAGNAVRVVEYDFEERR
ncbi:hypothetical protein QFC19_003920 [Naganishia cerealis]|uniref:Uncharacterized protein n=1 Tax=Naganishia cerealis TaxID=610337 RepID=A0ACC2W0E6_9TREE|nr:hypothetical protein QFC19_003920 [Naganishia cerealis]